MTSGKNINHNGFTMVEVLFATIVLLPVFAGVMLVFIRCTDLAEMARNSSAAVWAARDRMASIENTDIDQIFANFDGVAFTPANLNGMGVTYVDNSDPDLLEMTVSVSWQQKSGRIVGEDADLDGILDGGEDDNANGVLDSPVQFTTMIRRL